MTIVRRPEQQLLTRFPGIERYTVAGLETGSKQLKVGDLMWSPGARVPYHYHPEPKAEESQLLLSGQLEVVYDDFRFIMGPGDVLLAPSGLRHGFVNNSSLPARMITVFPFSEPSDEFIEEGPVKQGAFPPGVIFRQNITPTNPWPGVTRYDLIGAAQGAKSTFFSELVFEPGATAPTHYHPETEEAQFVIEGELRAIYGDDEDIPVRGGDCYLVEPGIRHGFSNRSDAEAVLLAIHPTTEPVRILVD